MKKFKRADVATKFDSYPPKVRRKLLALRQLVFQTAAATDGVGEIDETLKWGEPAYATQSKIGSTVRIDWKPKRPDEYAMYFNCQTNLVETFRKLFPHDFRFEGNRALVFDLDEQIPRAALTLCIAASLTYHLERRRTIRASRVRR